MTIEIRDDTFRRLQEHARPLVDSVDDVIARLLDQQVAEPASRNSEKRSGQQATGAVPSHLSGTSELRGFQRELWELVIKPMPTTRFSLSDVYARKQPLVELRPHVQEIEASIRAGLEKLRDKGLIEFIDNRGSYRRLM